MANKNMIKRDLRNKLNWLNENTKYNVAFLTLQGSQNYDMDTNKSDVDAKCFVVPSLEDMIANKQPVSKTYRMDDNSLIDVKDIRLLPELLYKCNPAYIETLYTEYFITNNQYHRVPTLLLKSQLKELREEICNRDIMRMMNALKGLVHQKQKHMERETEATARDIEIYGYTPKDLHHLIRCAYMAEEINRRKKVDFQSLMTLDFLTKPKFNELKMYKINPIPKIEAERLAQMYVNKVDRIVEEFEKENGRVVNQDVNEKMNQHVHDYIRFCLERDIITDYIERRQQKKLKEIEKERSNITEL